MTDEEAKAATVFTLDGVRRRLLFEGGSELEHWLMRQVDKANEEPVDAVAEYSDACLGRLVWQAFGGKEWRPKAGGVTFSFCLTMLDVAGGFQKFLDEWEEVR